MAQKLFDNGTPFFSLDFDDDGEHAVDGPEFSTSASLFSTAKLRTARLQRRIAALEAELSATKLRAEKVTRW